MYYRHGFDSYYPFGGWTLAIDTKERLIGISVCSPKDQYSRKAGRAIAEERAYSAVGDMRMFIITAPVGSHRDTNYFLHEALSNAITFVVERYPNTEFGVQFV